MDYMPKEIGSFFPSPPALISIEHVPKLEMGYLGSHFLLLLGWLFV